LLQLAGLAVQEVGRQVAHRAGVGLVAGGAGRPVAGRPLGVVVHRSQDPRAEIRLEVAEHREGAGDQRAIAGAVVSLLGGHCYSYAGTGSDGAGAGVGDGAGAVSGMGSNSTILGSSSLMSA